MKFVELPRYGPVHRFSDFHVYKALHALEDGKRRGRKALADSVGLGEGSMRTIVEYLRDQDYIEVKQTGIRISRHGADLLASLPLSVARLPPTDVSVGQRSVAARVHGVANKIKMGIEQRDAAVKAGADGATTIIVIGGRLIVPPDFDLASEGKEIAEELRRIFTLEDGDVIIIGTGSDYQRAEDGALAAAFELF
jgi:hypothetical protein